MIDTTLPLQYTARHQYRFSLGYQNDIPPVVNNDVLKQTWKDVKFVYNSYEYIEANIVHCTAEKGHEGYFEVDAFVVSSDV